jgi:hypothetical protein
MLGFGEQRRTVNKLLFNLLSLFNKEWWVCVQPITVVGRSKAWTVFARSNTGILGSNPTRGMGVCVRLFCVCVVPLCR